MNSRSNTKSFHVWHKPIQIIGCLALAASISQTFVAAAGETDAAVALYNKKQYAEALNAFTVISQKNPAGASAIYYAANCNLGLGHISPAISLYKKIIDNFPKSAEANSAKSVLQRMGIRYGVTDTAATGSSSPGPTDSTGAGKTVVSAESKSAVIEKMVVPVRALAGRPEVSSTAIDSVKQALQAYPTPLLAILHKRGCKIFITPTMIDKEPGLQNTKPAGYEEGATFKNCPGMFNGNVILCEHRFIGDGPDLQKSPDIVGTLRHELGHAVDWYLGDVTAKDAYKHQYLLDLGTIDDGIKSKIEYFCQKDFRGPSETFAELMCFKYGGRPSNNDRTVMVNGAFKLTSAYVTRVINEVDHGK